MNIKKVRQVDIAKALNVSVGLVSDALSGAYKKKRISEALAQKVITKAKEMGYQKNQLALGLRMGKSKLIGLVIADISNLFQAKMARNIESEIDKQGYQLIFGNSAEDSSKFSNILDTFISRQVEGVIAIPVEGSKSSVVAFQKKSRIPMIFVDRYIEDASDNAFVTDNFRGAFDLVSLLLSKGCKKIAAVAYGLSITPYKDRIKGYLSALQTVGIDGEKLIYYIDYSKEDEIRKQVDVAVRSIVKQGYDAVFFINDGLASRGLKTINHLGIKMPDELSVVAFDNPPLFDIIKPGITCYEQPVEVIARSAVAALMEQIASNNEETIKLGSIQGNLIIRGSC